MTKKAEEPVKCPCGRRTSVTTACGYYWVKCGKYDANGQCCWVGPDRKTKHGAINAWNRVMARRAGRGER